MCLSTVTISKSPKVDYFVGYKVFSKNPDGTPKFEIMQKKKVSSRWTTSDASKNTYEEDAYELGFHIFVDKEEALRYAGGFKLVYEVRYKEILAFGRQHNLDIVVANKMRVIKEVK